MAQQRGINTKLLLGFEATYGTAATVGFQMPFNTCNVVGTKTRTTPATMTGSRNPTEPFSGNIDVTGAIVVPADSLAMAYWLHAIFGAAVTTGADPYTHEFKIGASMPSFTLEKGFEDLAVNNYERFVGCRVSSFDMTAGGDGELILTLNVIGANQSEQASAFDASPTAVTIARLNNNQAAIEEGGGAIAHAQEFTLNVDLGLDSDQYVIGGGGVRGDVPEGIVAVTGNLKTQFLDKTLLDKAVNDTESSLKITITGAANSILEFEIQELLYAVNGIIVEGPTGLQVDLDFTGYFADGSESSAIVARLINSVASYSL